MEKLYLLANGYTNRFPNGNNPYQITTRVLEKCGEVASEMNHFEKSGIKSLKHGEPSKQHLADEIKQAINALVQLAVYYNVETELEESIDRSLAKMKYENLLYRLHCLSILDIKIFSQKTRIISFFVNDFSLIYDVLILTGELRYGKNIDC